MGDPAGVGPELIVRACGHPSLRRAARLIVVGDAETLRRAAGIARVRMPLRVITHPDEATGRGIEVIDLANLARPVVPGRPTPEGGRAAGEAIVRAAELARDGAVDAIVTAPISKATLRAGGFPYPGHTEMLAALCGAREFGMMLVGGRLRVMLATRHIPFKDVPSHATPEAIAVAARLADRALRRWFGISRPRLALAALNPHAGEEGLLGDEEQRLLTPTVEKVRAEGVDLAGPFPADTLFLQARQGRYDAVVALYHDQGLIPLKLEAFGRAVNLTLGLPYPRTSADHGTAFDLAGRNTARDQSLRAAVLLAAKLAREGKR